MARNADLGLAPQALRYRRFAAERDAPAGTYQSTSRRNKKRKNRTIRAIGSKPTIRQPRRPGGIGRRCSSQENISHRSHSVTADLRKGGLDLGAAVQQVGQSPIEVEGCDFGLQGLRVQWQAARCP